MSLRKVGIAFAAIVLISMALVWWVTAPRYIDLGDDVLMSMPECTGVEMSHPNEAFESYEEMRRLSEQRQACAEAKGRYYLKIRSDSFWERVSKPPAFFDTPPGN